jgi:hypothetical protein
LGTAGCKTTARKVRKVRNLKASQLLRFCERWITVSASATLVAPAGDQSFDAQYFP